MIQVVSQTVVTFVLVITMMMGVSGYMKEDSIQNKRQNINVLALEYMEQKYGETFEYSGPFGDSMSGTHDLLVKCASFPDQNILVEIENYKCDNKLFLDNYLAVKYREDTIDFLLNCANQVFGEATIFYNVDYQALSPELPVDATFNEFLADTRVPLKIDVEVKATDFVSKEQAEQTSELMSVKGTRFWLRIIVVNNSEYGTFDSKTLKKYVELQKFIQCAVISRLDGDNQTRWLEEE